MKGNSRILSALNALLADELAARDQYFVHSRMLEEWGFPRLATRIAHEVEDETEHASTLIKRILFLEGSPKMLPSRIAVGTDVPSILRADLEVEYKVIGTLRKAIALCEKEADYVTRDKLLSMLDDTEQDHAHWLEQQLRLIELMGLPNYLQCQAQREAS